MNEELLQVAQGVKKNAYAPYSNFHVGAALLGASGKIYSGCNVENRTYTPTVCAERNAIFSAIAKGERNFKTILVLGDNEGITFPCGVCLQVLSEFVSPDFPILLADKQGNITEFSLSQLLGHPFSFEK